MAKADIEGLRARIPADRAEFFIGFSPWPEDCKNWERSVDEKYVENSLRRLRRTVWDNPEEQQSRMMIDVLELSSAEKAVDALAEALEWNQLAEVPEGPRDLGYASFMHPEGVPPAAFFVQGNLFISVSSLGAKALDVTGWAFRLIGRLLERPSEARNTIHLDIGMADLSLGEPVPLKYMLPWDLGEYSFVKIFAEGARLTREDGDLLVTATQLGEVSIDLFAVEQGREPLAGQRSVNAS